MLDHSHKPRPHGVDFQGVKISSEAAKAGANNFSWGPLHRSEVSYLLKQNIKKNFFFSFGHTTQFMVILVPWPGIKPMPPELEA